MIKRLIIPIIFFSVSCAFGQIQFKVTEQEAANYKIVYTLNAKNSKQTKKLDTAKYLVSFNDEKYRYFATFGLSDFATWVAIDFDENILFKVYNTTEGEPNPDILRNDRIRTIDQDHKIGFANGRGEIVIPPKFEMVTSFHKGKAIIGENCQKIPWGDHSEEGGCRHFVTKCSKQGFIDHNGQVKLIGDYTFEQIRSKINWKEENY